MAHFVSAPSSVEDANDRGFIERQNLPGRGAFISVSFEGREYLREHRPFPMPVTANDCSPTEPQSLRAGSEVPRAWLAAQKRIVTKKLPSRMMIVWRLLAVERLALTRLWWTRYVAINVPKKVTSARRRKMMEAELTNLVPLSAITTNPLGARQLARRAKNFRDALATRGSSF